MTEPIVIQVEPNQTVIEVDVDSAIEVIGVEIPEAGGAQRLDDLLDVDGAALGLSGQALVKQLDAIWRPGTVEGGGGSAGLVHLQASPAATWSITHGLGRYPQVTVLDPQGERVFSDLDYGSINALTITHAAPLAGIAILT